MVRTRLISVTPLPEPWPRMEIRLPRDLRIIGRPRFAELDGHFWNLRRTEEYALQRTHWLSAEATWDGDPDATLLTDLAEILRTAMLGFQLWAPVGWEGLLIDCRDDENGTLRIDKIHFPEPYAQSIWARGIDLEKLEPSELPSLVEGTFTAIESGCVALINPFRFLEIGLQTAANHRRAGAVLMMMGLDGLVAAEKKVVFCRRIGRLLGVNSRIFPPDFAGRRPTYTVGQLAADMFDFRNLIAHGKEILPRFRERIDFQFEPAQLSFLRVENWSHGTLVTEGILFTLVKALRHIIERGWLERVSDQKRWKKWLDGADINWPTLL